MLLPIRKGAIAAALVVGALGLTHDNPIRDAEAGSRTWTMYCRGGGDFGVRLARRETISQDWLELLTKYYFKHGKKAYSKLDLGVGECTFPDRGVRSTEPTRLFYRRIAKSTETVFSFHQRRTRIDGIGVHHDGQDLTGEPRWGYLSAVSDPNKIVEVEIFDGAREGMFIVKRVRAVHPR